MPNNLGGGQDDLNYFNSNETRFSTPEVASNQPMTSRPVSPQPPRQPEDIFAAVDKSGPIISRPPVATPGQNFGSQGQLGMSGGGFNQNPVTPGLPNNQLNRQMAPSAGGSLKYLMIGILTLVVVLAIGFAVYFFILQPQFQSANQASQETATPAADTLNQVAPVVQEPQIIPETATNTQVTPIEATTTAVSDNLASKQYVEIKEMGIKFLVDPAIGDVVYKYEKVKKNQDISYDREYAYLTTKTLADLNSNCGIGNGNKGVITIEKYPGKPTNSIHKDENQQYVGVDKQFDNFSIGFIGPQAVCTETKDQRVFEDKVIAELSNAENSVVLIEPVASTTASNSLDTDGDGLTDYDEINIYHTNPKSIDTDNDGLTDYEEVKIYHTDPNNPDTDGDGYKDGQEVKNGYNPNGPGRLLIVK